MGNFKRRYSKEKKLIEWGTPKYIQMEQEKPLHSIPAKRKTPCKKGKKKHQFQIVNKELSRHFGMFIYYRCTVCGKKDIKIEK